MKKILFWFSTIGTIFLFVSQSVFAANTTISFTPQSGSFDRSFSVDLIIDGHGDKFNAAQANVTVPSNLAIKDLSLGDCNFSFLKTPSVQNLSFAGVILSQYSTKCTVYTLSLVPIAKGDATFSLTNVSVKRYGDAASILSSTTKGTYVLTAALKSPSVLAAKTTKSLEGVYTVELTISEKGNKPVNEATLNLNTVSEKDHVKGKTNDQGTAQFHNIKAGVYSVVIEQNGKKIGETIINVSGSNPVLTLGINIDAQKNNPLMKDTHTTLNVFMTNPLWMSALLAFGMLVGIGTTIFAIRIKK